MSSSTVFSGSMTGAGGLILAGTGTFSLAGVNTYSGQTTLQAATLQMQVADAIASSNRVVVDAGAAFDLNDFNQSIQDLSGAGSVTLGTATLTVAPSSPSTTFSGSITGAGSLIKNGANELVLTGTSNYTGPTSVIGGLRVNGSLTTSAVTVQSNGVLAGTGTVHAPIEIQDNGIALPGNSIGTLFIDSITFDSGGSYLVQLSPTQSSLINATGTILVDPGAILQVFPKNGNYTGGTTYTIAETSPGLINGGTNFVIQSANPDFNFTLATDPTDHFLFLTLLANVSVVLPTSNLSGNRLVIANYLNSLRHFPPLVPIFNELGLLFDSNTGLSTQQLDQALDLISPARNAFSAFAVENALFSFNDILESRCQNQRLSRAFRQNGGDAQLTYLAQAEPIGVDPVTEETPPSTIQNQRFASAEKFSVWVAPFGEFAHQETQKQTPSFNWKTGGLLAGFDARVSESFLIGGSAGYAYLHLDESAGFGKAWTNDYLLSIYGTIEACHFYADFAVWGGYYRTHNKRNLFFLPSNPSANSEFHGWQVAPHLDFGYDFFFCWAALEPYARFDWAIVLEDGFEEHGAAPLNMKQQGRTGSLLRSEVGLSSYQTHRFQCGGMFIARESLSYINKKPFWNNGFTTAAIVGAPGGPFTVETLTATQNLVGLGGELYYHFSNGAFLSLDYEGEFSGPFWNNTAIFKAGKEF